MFRPASDVIKLQIDSFISKYGLTQTVPCSTFSSGSLLDLVLTDKPGTVTRCGVRHCHYSPHKFVRWFVNFPRPHCRPAIVMSRSINRIDPDAFVRDLSVCDWSDVTSAVTVSEQWAAFLGAFMPILDAHAPQRRVKIRNPTAPPVTDPTKQLMRRRRAALRTHGHDSDCYKTINRETRAAIRRDSREHILSTIRTGGPHTLWRNTRKFIDSKKPLRNVTPLVSADAMNAYFVDVGPSVARQVAQRGNKPNLPNLLPRVGACALYFTPIDLDTLATVVYGMPATSACGSDGICIRAVKKAFPAIGPIVQHLINTSIVNNDVPDQWKQSLVNPIHKSGDPTTPSNFRPISLIPIITKILERVVQQQLFTYVTSNHLLADTQHGFRTHHSTETALIHTTDTLLTATDAGQISLLCLLDMSKAFDVIDHDRLITKLSALGISTDWFRTYLPGHTQRVTFTDKTGTRHTSDARPNTMGVFQGSALGPLLYTIFTNDLSIHAPDSTIIQYADDTQLITSGHRSTLQHIISRMEHSLTNLDAWFSANTLKVNPDKTQLIVIGTKQNTRALPDITIAFRDRNIQPGKTVKNLGLVFDTNMNWEAHIQQLTTKCFGTLTSLSHIRHYLPSSILPTLISGLVLSKIRYCLSVYGNGSGQNLRAIQKIMNFSSRVIAGRRKFSHSSDVRERLGWLDATHLTQYHTLTQLHKTLRHHLPVSIHRTLQQHRQTRSRSTRQDNKLKLPAARLETGKRRFCYRGAALYNLLPTDITDLPPKRFKRALKRYLRTCQNQT